MTSELDKLAAGLRHAECRVLQSPRFDPKGWEPANPHAPLVVSMIDKGLFTRANGRCGFEAFKDAFIVPTPLCLALRDHLNNLDKAGEA